jgi:hypothetical protein
MRKTFKANKYEIKIADLAHLLYACPIWIEKIKLVLSDDEGICDGVRDINLRPEKDKIVFWFKNPVTIIAEDRPE